VDEDIERLGEDEIAELPALLREACSTTRVTAADGRLMDMRIRFANEVLCLRHEIGRLTGKEKP
jgi:hypothetical protein